MESMEKESIRIPEASRKRAARAIREGRPFMLEGIGEVRVGSRNRILLTALMPFRKECGLKVNWNNPKAW